MKKLFFLLVFLVSLKAYSQCGVYLTAEDFIAGKLTDEGIDIGIPSGPGEDDRVVVTTSHGKKAHKWADVWGYKDNLSYYRILYGQPMIIVCRGKLIAYTPYGPIKKTGKNTTYYRKVDGFGEVYVSTDFKNPDGISPVNDFSQLWALLDKSVLQKVKEYYVARTAENESLEATPEQIISFYNSLFPGYVEPTYSVIKVIY
jgi:hypothetical protein